MANNTRYISVRNWRKFQHYDPEKRTPPWIKNMTELMSSDTYLSLSAAERGVLHGLWLEYARSRCELRLDVVSDPRACGDDTASVPRGYRLDTARLTRRLGVRVSNKTLAALNHAGFITIVASKALAEGYRDASPRARAEEVEAEVEKEVEEEKEKAFDLTELRPPDPEAEQPSNGTHPVGDLMRQVAGSFEDIPF